MAARHRELTDATSEEIDVVYVRVHALQFHPLLSWHVTIKLLKIVYLLVKTLTHQMYVAWNTVLSGSGDVEGDQITTKTVLSPSVQVVAYVVRDEWIGPGCVTGRHSSENVVQLTVF